MEICCAYYELIPKHSLNAHSTAKSRKGALLKVLFESGRVGYADCHAWPELGDLPLEDHLRLLASGSSTSLIRCALELAEIDAEFRKQKRNALKDASQPLSHYLINDLASCSLNLVESIISQGYTHVKIKMGRDIERDSALLQKFFVGATLKLRLDFNEICSLSSFHKFLKNFENHQMQFDFIEDPFSYHEGEWRAIQSDGWTLACDRQALKAAHQTEAAKVIIVKPAVHPYSEWSQWAEQKRIVTSYMGHPVGQCAAAYVADQIDPNRISVHGLLSQHVYLPTPFSSQLNWTSPRFIPVSGNGFGFDRELDSLDWQMIRSGTIDIFRNFTY